MRFTPARSVAVLLLVLTANLSSAQQKSQDWNQWRGPLRNGISAETGLLKKWPDEGPPLAWQTRGLGRGFSSVVVSNGKLFTMGKRQGGVFLIALNAKDGSELWATPLGNNANPNCTPTVDGKFVFALSLGGDLVCADTETGKLIWKKNYAQEFGGRMMSSWGYSESPLVDGNSLICTPGGRSAMIAALDKRTCRTLWKTRRPQGLGDRGKAGAGYSSIVISNATGVKQYVQLTGKGVIGVRASDGRLLWVYNRIANGTANIPTPIIKDDYVFCSSGYGTGAALLKIERRGQRFNPREMYFLDAKTMQNHHGGMIMIGDYIYCGHGHNKGFPLCLNWKTGRVAWSAGRGPGSGSAAIAFADGRLYFRYENHIMALISAKSDGYSLDGKFRLPTRNGQSWPHPAISGGKLYLRDQDELLCYDIRAQ